MRILLDFKEGHMIVPYNKMMEAVDELKDTKCPFDGQERARTLKITRFHNFNKKKTRCLVYVEQEQS